jgi:hypothetical protein
VKPSASEESPTKSVVSRYQKLISTFTECLFPQSSVVPSENALSCVVPTPPKAAHSVGDKVPNQFIVTLKPGVDRMKHIASVKALITEGAKCDSIKSQITLDGAAFAKLSFYGGIFGPSVISAIKKSPDVKSVAGNTLLEVDSPISFTSSVATNMTKRALFFDTTQTNGW